MDKVLPNHNAGVNCTSAIEGEKQVVPTVSIAEVAFGLERNRQLKRCGVAAGERATPTQRVLSQSSYKYPVRGICLSDKFLGGLKA